MKYEPRLKVPGNKNKYYNTENNGGYSKCIEGNKKTGCWSNSLNVLPNCVGYAWGRFNEIGDYKSFKHFIRGNAEDLYQYAIDKGYKVGKEPRVGAIMVWAAGNLKNGSDGCGHVAIVEKIYDKTHVVTSESGWSFTTKFKLIDREIGKNGKWGQSSSYRFLGFIYHPDVDDEWGVCPFATPTKVIKRGCKGNNVKWLQWYMNKLGYPTELDGSFGPKTEATLKQIQKVYKLDCDGKCGPATRNTLINL